MRRGGDGRREMDGKGRGEHTVGGIDIGRVWERGKARNGRIG